MIGRDILSKVFNITFKQGNYSTQIAPLDAQGWYGRKQQNDIAISIIEELDKIDERLKKLENAKPSAKK